MTMYVNIKQKKWYVQKLNNGWYKPLSNHINILFHEAILSIFQHPTVENEEILHESWQIDSYIIRQLDTIIQNRIKMCLLPFSGLQIRTRLHHPVLPSCFEKQSMIGCKIYISKMVNTFDSQYFIIEWRRSMQLFSILIMAKMYVMALCEKSSPGAIVD